jgi:MFS family permease
VWSIEHTDNWNCGQSSDFWRRERADLREPANSARSETTGRYKWAVVGMLWFICFFNYADRQALFAVFPLLQKQYGFNKEQLGLIGAAFTWVYALSAPFAGQVADRLPRKAVILGGLTIWSVITGFTAACSRVWHFVLVRGAEGLGETFYFPASMSLISDYHGPKTRSRAMSLHQTSVYAGTIGGSAFAGWMGLRYGWSSSFMVLGAAGCVLAILLFSFLREPRQNLSWPRHSERRDTLPVREFLLEIAGSPSVLLLMFAFFGANFVALVFLTWMPTFLKEKFGLNLAAAGLGATFFIQAASMAGATAGGWLADRWRQRLPGGRMLAQAIGALAGAPFIFLCGFTRDIGVLIVAMSLFGLAKGLYDANIWASLYDVVTPTRRGTAVGLMNMVGWLGGGLGAYAVGLAVTRWRLNMSQAIEYTALIYIGVAALLLLAAVAFAPRDVHRSSETPRA